MIVTNPRETIGHNLKLNVKIVHNVCPREDLRNGTSNRIGENDLAIIFQNTFVVKNAISATARCETKTFKLVRIVLIRNTASRKTLLPTSPNVARNGVMTKLKIISI